MVSLAEDRNVNMAQVFRNLLWQDIDRLLVGGGMNLPVGAQIAAGHRDGAFVALTGNFARLPVRTAQRPKRLPASVPSLAPAAGSPSDFNALAGRAEPSAAGARIHRPGRVWKKGSPGIRRSHAA